MADLALEMEEAIIDAGPNVDFEKIAKNLNVPVEWVEDTYDAMFDDYDGQPDEAQEWYDFDPDC
jgi:hypothetical protein